jgi:hypothetical protein
MLLYVNHIAILPPWYNILADFITVMPHHVLLQERYMGISSSLSCDVTMALIKILFLMLLTTHLTCSLLIVS